MIKCMNVSQQDNCGQGCQHAVEDNDVVSCKEYAPQAIQEDPLADWKAYWAKYRDDHKELQAVSLDDIPRQVLFGMPKEEREKKCQELMLTMMVPRDVVYQGHGN